MATADTVIIYDSDWNPQVDFQAIDRIHRIGQKKQVQLNIEQHSNIQQHLFKFIYLKQVNVYRLITENTVDQRIVQRAEIKERLDRMVIKSSRKNGKPKEEHNHKDVLLDVIRFGANKMLSEKGSDVNFDLKRLLCVAKLKEAEEKAKIDAMTLEQSSSTSVYQFEGFDFRAKQPVAEPISLQSVTECVTKVLPSMPEF